MILTEPASACELKLKPFTNNIKIHFCPVNPAINMSQLSGFVNSLAPKHIVSPYDATSLNLVVPCVLEVIAGGQTRIISESELGSLKYRGKCPTSIASVIRMQASSSGKMLSRITDLMLEFKDDKY